MGFLLGFLWGSRLVHLLETWWGCQWEFPWVFQLVPQWEMLLGCWLVLLWERWLVTLLETLLWGQH